MSVLAATVRLPHCRLCGEDRPERFTQHTRWTCRACRTAQTVTAQRFNSRPLDLPVCEGCTMKYAPLVAGLCPLCVRELAVA